MLVHLPHLVFQNWAALLSWSLSSTLGLVQLWFLPCDIKDVSALYFIIRVSSWMSVQWRSNSKLLYHNSLTELFIFHVCMSKLDASDLPEALLWWLMLLTSFVSVNFSMSIPKSSLNWKKKMEIELMHWRFHERELVVWLVFTVTGHNSCQGTFVNIL